MLNINKNFGISHTTGDWVLILDADERISPELKEEIKKNLDSEEINGYWIPRKNYILSKWIKYAGWYPDYQLRLIRNGKGKFAEKHVHEMIEAEGKTAYLESNIVHLNYESINQLVYKHLFIYAPNEAEDILRRGYEFEYLDAIRFPCREFISRFFAREGYREGMHGLMLSLFMAFYHFIIFSLIWEKMKFQEISGGKIFQGVEFEFQKSYREIMFWFMSEKIKNSKHIYEKLKLKIKRKIFF